MVISSTDKQPERQYLEDGRNHTGVAGLLTHGRGSSRVVWAGVGSRVAGVGDGEMARIRAAIVDERSYRNNVAKLEGIKPYSRHGTGW